VARQAAQQRWGSGRDFHSYELVGLHRLVIAESARFPKLALILHSSGDARHIARLPEHIRAERGPASDPLVEPMFPCCWARSTAGGCSASTRRPLRRKPSGTRGRPWDSSASD
jgi:transcriptional repressor AefR-like protein